MERITRHDLESWFYSVGVLSYASDRLDRRTATITPITSSSTISGAMAYRETDVEAADLETVIVDLLDGKYPNPIRVVAFNTFEGWSQDASADIAQDCDGAAISNCRTYRRGFRTSSSGTRAATVN